jgi:hypothetical protein
MLYGVDYTRISSVSTDASGVTSIGIDDGSTVRINNLNDGAYVQLGDGATYSGSQIKSFNYKK